MTKNKYLPIQDIKEKIFKLERNIRDKVTKETLYPRDRIFVNINFIKDDKPVDIEDEKIKGVCLSSGVPEVYQSKCDLPGTSIIRVRIIIQVEDVEYKPSELVLPEKECRFYTYKEYLKFFTQKYIESGLEYSGYIEVRSTIKEIECELQSILSEKYCNKTCHLIDEDFIILSRYLGLPKEVQKEVDAFTCPIIVNTHDVSTSVRLNRIDIRLDKKDMLKHELCTERYKEELKGFL